MESESYEGGVENERERETERSGNETCARRGACKGHTQTFYNASSISLFAGYMSSLAHTHTHTYSTHCDVEHMCAYPYLYLYSSLGLRFYARRPWLPIMIFTIDCRAGDNGWRGVLLINWSTHKSRQPLIPRPALLLLLRHRLYIFS